MNMSDDESTIGGSLVASDHHFDFLGEHMESYNLESSAVHRKLQSKVEALRILRKELDKFRVERDQYKLMAETLQLRYSALKHNGDLSGCPALSENKSSVAALLHETRERNLGLTTEVETLKQKLYELQGDIELLRASELHTLKRVKGETIAAKKLNFKEELQWKLERANFICHLESLKKKNAQLSFDIKAIIDEKEELITERDAYKCKAHRLNHELFVALKANERHPKFLDIDGILLENKYLLERLKNFESELEMSKQSINKYKTMLETKRKKGIIKLATSSNDENILSPKQVKAMLEIGVDLPARTDNMQDLKSLCITLLDNLNDKNLAMTHQKKTNKILATKIAELERRLQSLVGLESSSTTEGFNYAPSQFLLSGYCPSMVDNDNEKSGDEEASVEAACDNSEPDVYKTVAHDAGCLDDGLSSLSTESGRSILSSEYGVDMCLSDFVNKAMNAHKSSSATTDSGNCGFSAAGNVMSHVSNTIARERIEDLKDLPPHLAVLVQKALHELDMLDYDKGVTTRAQQTPPKEITIAEEDHAIEALEYDN